MLTATTTAAALDKQVYFKSSGGAVSAHASKWAEKLQIESANTRLRINKDGISQKKLSSLCFGRLLLVQFLIRVHSAQIQIEKVHLKILQCLKKLILYCKNGSPKLQRIVQREKSPTNPTTALNTQNLGFGKYPIFICQLCFWDVLSHSQNIIKTLDFFFL